jgi:DNA segregation ATPase FtsK/SpoIIIE, S-DNA-T family
MAAVREGFYADALVPEEWRSALRRRIRELGGLAFIVLSAAAAIALATWSVQDPSLSHATSAPVRNLLGFPGAIAADLLMQLFGVAALALIVPVAVWGWRLLTHRSLDRERLRLVLWLLGALLASAFASCLSTTAAWPLPTGFGGVVGDALLRLPAWLLRARLSGGVRLLVCALTGTAALLALVFAMGLGWRDRIGGEPAWEESDAAPVTPPEVHERRSFVPLGWFYHQLLSFKALLSRVLARAIGSAPRRGPQRAVGALAASEAEEEEEGEEGEEETEDGTEDEEAEEADSDESEADAPPQGGRKRLKVSNAHRLRGGFELPSIGLLAAPKSSDRTTLSVEAIQENATALESVLADFGVRGEIINARPGPVVTLYELEPAPGIKSSRVIGLADDIARSMSALSTRVAVVPGRNVIGIELPNPRREKVYLRELLAGEDYSLASAKLPLCLGKTIGGESVIVDLARMPHLLIAGTTGSGKSVAINTMILSLVYRLRPEDCRLIMVDPKMLELSVYDGIPHLLTPVVTDPKKAVIALKWAVREMEDRYRRMSKLGVRNIDGYNARVAEAMSRGETLSRTVHTGYDRESGEAIYEKETLELEPLSYIVVIVDEMADLMMVAGKDIEGAIQRIAQMARAAGIHVILATQRPSVDVITGTIKANFPTRISFQVTSKIDSRTILGEQGAEQLLGQGDMLYMAGGGRISRVHGPFVSDEEVEKVVRHLKTQGAPQYLDAVTAEAGDDEDNPVFDAAAMGGSEGSDLYQQAVQVVLRDRKASTSYIQRRLQIGYNRAASLMERMEQEGVVGAANHAGKREILVGEGADER